MKKNAWLMVFRAITVMACAYSLDCANEIKWDSTGNIAVSMVMVLHAYVMALTFSFLSSR